MAELIIAHMYPNLMNLYGDRGNLICLQRRIEWYGHKASIVNIDLNNHISFDQYDMLFMGGGSDREQGLVYNDLLKKTDVLKAFIENGLPMLCICGAYQLLGKSYKSYDGKVMDGLSLFDFYTEGEEERLIGNIIIKARLEQEEISVVGFENHGGRTYFVDNTLEPFGKVIKGFGNNGQDSFEGLKYQNLIGTYMHGPLLPKNPMVADFFINKMFERKGMKAESKINNEIEMFAHDQIKNRILQ